MKSSFCLTVLLAFVGFGAIGCTCTPPAGFGITVTSVPVPGAPETQMNIDGAGFTPVKNMQIVIKRFPNQSSDLVRGATVKPDGTFHYTEIFWKLRVGQQGDPNVDIIVIGKDLVTGCTTTRTTPAMPYFLPN